MTKQRDDWVGQLENLIDEFWDAAVICGSKPNEDDPNFSALNRTRDEIFALFRRCQANGDPLTNEGEPMSETKQRWRCKHCGQPQSVLSLDCCYSPTGTHTLIEDNGDPLTAAASNPHEAAWAKTRVPQQPTGSGSAYSVEEHMFQQDEIDKRHPLAAAPDAFDELNDKLRLRAAVNRPAKPERENWSVPPQPTDQQRSEAVTPAQGWLSGFDAQKAIAERDATIAELRAEVVVQKAMVLFLQTKEAQKVEQIAALQARVRELEDFVEWLNSDAITLLDYEQYKAVVDKKADDMLPTTEK